MQKTKYVKFDIKKEADGSWVVFDIFRGIPAVVASRKMLGFREDISRQLLGRLNAQDMLRRASLGF
jgi:hypothetical protein